MILLMDALVRDAREFASPLSGFYAAGMEIPAEREYPGAMETPETALARPSEKLVFVVLAWGMGACLLGLAPSVVYSQLCALIGLGLLGLGALKGLPPILRWYYERPFWRAVALRSQVLNEALNQVTPDRYGHIRLPEPERRSEEERAA